MTYLVPADSETTLCGACTNVLREEYDEETEIYIHPVQNPVQVLISSAATCSLCAFVWKRLEPCVGLCNALKHPCLQNSILLQTIRRDELEVEKFILVYSFRHLNHSGQDMTVSVVLTPMTTQVKALPLRCNNIEQFTTHPLILDQITDWLSKCTRNHYPCRENLSSTSSLTDCFDLPTRLIDVGIGEESPRLCYSKNCTPGSKYVTLSHCWGKTATTRLTNSTHDDFCRKIPLQTLPRTFQDAILLTRKFNDLWGVRYIWIDALCIFQDSVNDWQMEGERMSDIYGRAYLNIAATWGRNGQSGLIPTDPPLGHHLRVRKAESGENFDSMTADPETFLGYSSDEWAESIDNAPLNSRAWVYQERLLSSRILHFSCAGIYWECQQSHASMVFPEENIFSKQPMKRIHRAILNTGSRSIMYKSEVKELWNQSVAKYSSASLTRHEDKLPAIAGVAKRLARHFDSNNSMNGGYLAGMWRYELETQLLWKVTASSDLSQTINEYRAPSWSWTSVDGQVELGWTTWRQRTLVEILEVSTQLNGPNPFGQVCSGMLRLRGQLWHWRRPVIELGEKAHPVDYRTQTILSGSQNIVLDPRFKASPENYDMYILPLFQASEFRPSQTLIDGLLLQNTHKPLVRGQYRRIGTCRVYVEPGTLQPIHAKGISSVSEYEYEEFDGEKQYTITII